MNSSSAASKMTKAHGRRPSKNRMRDHLSGWLFVLPLLVVFLVFIGIPVFRTVFYLGFTDYNLMKDPAWVGLSNYEKLFTSRRVLSARGPPPSCWSQWLSRWPSAPCSSRFWSTPAA